MSDKFLLIFYIEGCNVISKLWSVAQYWTKAYGNLWLDLYIITNSYVFSHLYLQYLYLFNTIIYLAVNSTLFWTILDTDLTLYIMTDKGPRYNLKLLININNKQQNKIMLHYRSIGMFLEKMISIYN